MEASRGSKKPGYTAPPNQSNIDTNDGRQCQAVVAQAIEQYTDRHNFNFSEEGAKDLRTLSTCNPSNLYKIFQSSPETGLPTGLVETNGQRYGIN